MKVIFYDVEHGSCCHIITPNNKHILIDIGSKEDYSITEYINNKYFGGCGGQIEQLIITHPHEDHIYDLPKLCKVLPPKVLMRPKEAYDIIPKHDNGIHKLIAECANRMNLEYCVPVLEGCSPTNSKANGGVHFDFIFPKAEWTSLDDINSFSNIIIMTYSGYKFVLTGDNPAPILKHMIDFDYCNIKTLVKDATVLLAPHHGRTNEFCKEFFDCVNPIWTVVSDKNIVHQTQGETSKLYQGRGGIINNSHRYVLTTRLDGSIRFEVDSHFCVGYTGKEGY